MGSGTNSQGNHYNTPGGTNSSGGSSYHYSNSNGSYYCEYYSFQFVRRTYICCLFCLTLTLVYPLIIAQTPTTTVALTTTVAVEAPPTLLPVVSLGPTLPTNKFFADAFVLNAYL